VAQLLRLPLQLHTHRNSHLRCAVVRVPRALARLVECGRVNPCARCVRCTISK
jgi:hypothetical protein